MIQLSYMARPKGSKNKKNSEIVVEEKKSEPIFHVKILVNNEPYEATGDDLKEIVSGFTPPDMIKNETNVIVTKNKKTIQRDLKVYEARRLFNNDTVMILFVDNLLKQLG